MLVKMVRVDLYDLNVFSTECIVESVSIGVKIPENFRLPSSQQSSAVLQFT